MGSSLGVVYVYHSKFNLGYCLIYISFVDFKTLELSWISWDFNIQMYVRI
jgi:hypothetical protein